MKVIAWYLPQFHEIPENNKWWGEGFTEWVNVKNAEKYYEDQYQPRVPLNHHYYDLLEVESLRWQVKIAKEYGIYGFCMHHYWFGGKLLLEKPVEKYLQDQECALPFCICWANEHWTNQWVSNDQKILIEQNYGQRKEWEAHFYYLLPFLKSEKYIKINEKPLFVIYRPELIECLNDMLDCWGLLAEQNGLGEILFAYQGKNWVDQNKDDSRFEYEIEYQPGKYFADLKKKDYFFLNNIKNMLPKFILSNCKNTVQFAKTILSSRSDRMRVNGRTYDEVWEGILKQSPLNHKSIPGAFVDWDNTPRKGKRGTYLKNSSPEKFEAYFEQLVRKTITQYEKDIIFIFAWNEWAEGGYLEPDEKNGYGYLQAIKNVLTRIRENEKNYFINKKT